jgi:group I intron endonuclease
MATVYLVRNNENNKVYYGSTKRDLSTRFREHKSRANTGSKEYALYDEMRRVGVDKFYIVPILINVDTSDVEEAERTAIRSHNNKHELLNMFEGAIKSDKDKLVELYREGWTIKELSIRFKMCKKTVSKFIKENGATVRNWNEEQKAALEIEEVRRLYFDEGLPSAAIGKLFNTSNVTIIKFLKRHGYKPRPSCYKPQRPPIQ